MYCNIYVYGIWLNCYIKLSRYMLRSEPRGSPRFFTKRELPAVEEYEAGVTESAENCAPVPQCCAAVTADGKTTADAGITVNGFHDRKGLPPGLRSFFAEEQ